ncbi:hypothetical protein A6A08_05965 [Nocardiopsis sp. TSRI0078]|nr:hypothetical protein A6A08_05965 [Nocardiopsis sp. TSRI0078]
MAAVDHERRRRDVAEAASGRSVEVGGVVVDQSRSIAPGVGHVTFGRRSDRGLVGARRATGVLLLAPPLLLPERTHLSAPEPAASTEDLRVP